MDNSNVTPVNHSKNNIFIIIALVAFVLMVILIAGIIFASQNSNSQDSNPQTNQQNNLDSTSNNNDDSYPETLPIGFCPEKLVFTPSLYAESNGKKYILTQADLNWVETNCPNTQKGDAAPENTNASIWSFDDKTNTWKSNGNVPTCPNPLTINSPVNVSLATGILYPGQTRGGDYKPHGGFRFDNISNNEVEIRVPMDSLVVSGTRFLYDGEIQYGFDFLMPCGIQFRLGHLRELTPKFQEIANKFREPTEMDSRGTSVSPSVSVQANELIATRTGVMATKNTFVDFGVYDLRQKNEASKDLSWASSHPVQFGHYAICWFDWLKQSEESIVRSLPPADPNSGKNSDYCK